MELKQNCHIDCVVYSPMWTRKERDVSSSMCIGLGQCHSWSSLPTIFLVCPRFLLSLPGICWVSHFSFPPWAAIDTMHFENATIIPESVCRTQSWNWVHKDCWELLEWVNKWAQWHIKKLLVPHSLAKDPRFLYIYIYMKALLAVGSSRVKGRQGR